MSLAASVDSFHPFQKNCNVLLPFQHPGCLLANTSYKRSFQATTRHNGILPSVMSMRKKMMDQKTEPVMVAMASGYTMNTNPGPARKTTL